MRSYTSKSGNTVDHSVPVRGAANKPTTLDRKSGAAPHLTTCSPHHAKSGREDEGGALVGCEAPVLSLDGHLLSQLVQFFELLDRLDRSKWMVETKLCNRCGQPGQFSLAFLLSTLGVTPRKQKCTKSLRFCALCIQRICRAMLETAPSDLIQPLQAAYTALAGGFTPHSEQSQPTFRRDAAPNADSCPQSENVPLSDPAKRGAALAEKAGACEAGERSETGRCAPSLS